MTHTTLLRYLPSKDHDILYVKDIVEIYSLFCAWLAAGLHTSSKCWASQVLAGAGLIKAAVNAGEGQWREINLIVMPVLA